jgi:RNA 3'-terminal phosphate cyclase (ATP)
LLEIDGSFGEGGGQILRNAVALSTLTKKPVKITNIRANRPNPGIKPQHYISIKSIQDLCNAKITGLEIGSPTLSFTPGDFKGGTYNFDIGTAGSITLAFQACILASILSKEPVTIKLNGGTDVKWSPSWDYFTKVFLPLLKKMGVSVDAKLIARGYYPKGGGEAEITINLCKKIKPLRLDSFQEFSVVKGVINIAGLPDHISTRMKHSAIKLLLKDNLLSNIEIERFSSLSQGAGITLWIESNDTIIGSTVLGERGISSEEVGKTVGLNLLSEIQSQSTLDVHAFDQVLPYLALAEETSSCFVKELSNHANTNIWLIKKFIDVDFEAKNKEDNFKITISPKK